MNDSKAWLLEVLEHKNSLWFVALAMWGGTAKYLTKVRKDEEKIMLVGLVVAWVVSGFSGLLTAYLCMEFSMSIYLTCFLSGMAGHMGKQALDILEAKAKHFLEKRK